MNKFYSIALSLLIVSGSSFLDAKNPCRQQKLNKNAIRHLLKKRYRDINHYTFPGTYVGSCGTYIKEDTHSSKRGIIADKIADRLTKKRRE